MLLSDVILLPQNLPDTIDTVTAPCQESASTVVNSLSDGDPTAVVNSLSDGGPASVLLADAALPPSAKDMVFDDWTTTILVVLAVLAALSLCLHFVFKYRRTNRPRRK